MTARESNSHGFQESGEIDLLGVSACRAMPGCIWSGTLRRIGNEQPDEKRREVILAIALACRLLESRNHRFDSHGAEKITRVAAQVARADRPIDLRTDSLECV